MLRLHLQIQFIRILYNQAPKKSHYINFTLQNEDDDELHYDQKFITSQTDIVELDKLSPFHFSMIVSNNKMTLCPFVLSFVSKTNPTVVRKMPIHKGHILKHYLKHQLFQEITALEQVYTFDEGEIIYTVKVVESETVSDEQETQKFNIQFSKTSSILSESMRSSRERSLINSRNNFDSKDTALSTQINPIAYQENYDFLNVPEPQLHSKSSMSKMSIEEIAEQLELVQDKEEDKGSEQLSETENWLIKLGKGDKQRQSSTEKMLLAERSNFKLRVVFWLIVIGLAAMLFDFLTDKTYQRKGGPSAIKRHKNVKKIHNSRSESNSAYVNRI